MIASSVLVAVLLLACVSPSGQHADTKHAYRAEANPDGTGPTTDETSVGCSGGQWEGESCDKDGAITWDPKGYVMFCPCMGRIGNQAEHYLGALAFAKALDRTLVLPPLRTFSHASYGELFQVEPIQEFHRVILMEDFMKHLAPKYWPAGKRIGYCHLPEKSEVDCDMKNGNPFGPFWNHFGIDFDDCVKYQIHNAADITNEDSMQRTKQTWDARFPSEEHPVLALRGSPGSFPMLAGNRVIQKYLKWAPAFFADAGEYIRETFGGEAFIGVHLRNGADWVKACEHAEGVRRFMASPQCLENTPEVMVTKDICLPSLSLILEQTLNVFRQVQAKHLFIATDKQPHLAEFKELLQPLGVSVHYQKPRLVETDLMILGQADYFIGNCVSSFTSFVKRERDANGRPSAFWGQDLNL